MTNNINDDDRTQHGRSTATTTHDEWTRENWESLHSNPDEHADLDYELSEWERFETLDGTDQVMFLPEDEAEIEDAAFVIAETDLHVDLVERT